MVGDRFIEFEDRVKSNKYLVLLYNDYVGYC